MDNFSFRRYSKDTKDIILKMLTKNPERRITPAQALKHKYFLKNGFTKLENNNKQYQNKDKNID